MPFCFISVEIRNVKAILRGNLTLCFFVAAAIVSSDMTYMGPHIAHGRLGYGITNADIVKRH